MSFKIYIDLETRVKVVCYEFLDGKGPTAYQIKQIYGLAEKCNRARKPALCNVLAWHCATTGHYVAAKKIWEMFSRSSDGPVR